MTHGASGVNRLVRLRDAAPAEGRARCDFAAPSGIFVYFLVVVFSRKGDISSLSKRLWLWVRLRHVASDPEWIETVARFTFLSPAYQFVFRLRPLSVVQSQPYPHLYHVLYRTELPLISPRGCREKISRASSRQRPVRSLFM